MHNTSVMNLILKRADLEKDAETLFEMDVKCFNRPFDLPARSVQNVKNYLNNATIYFCYMNDLIVGSFSYKKKEDDTFDFLQMIVLPEYQKRGIGKFMIRKMLAKMKGKDVYGVTHPKNNPAIILYLKSGFQIYDFKDNYFGDGQPRLLLKRQS